MKSNYTSWLGTILAVGLGFCWVSCAGNSSTVPESEFATKIIGDWQGTVGDLKESMSINGDGTFVCHLYPKGFIARTLSQGVTGTIRGTWSITGAVISLKITGAENETLKNKTASSTILAFKEDEILLKSRGGETSPFRRVRAL